MEWMKTCKLQRMKRKDLISESIYVRDPQRQTRMMIMGGLGRVTHTIHQLVVEQMTNLCSGPEFSPGSHKFVHSAHSHTYNVWGRIAIPKRTNFWKSSEGGGVVSNPKIYVAKFGPLNRAFSA